MKVGDLILLSDQAVRVYGFESRTGLIVGRTHQKIYSAAEGYPDDYHIMINGRVELVGFAIEEQCEVINAAR